MVACPCEGSGGGGHEGDGQFAAAVSMQCKVLRLSTPASTPQPFTCYDAFWAAHTALPYPPTPPLPVPAALTTLAPGVEATAAAAGAVPLKQLGIMSQEEEMSNAQLNYHVSDSTRGAWTMLRAVWGHAAGVGWAAPSPLPAAGPHWRERQAGPLKPCPAPPPSPPP